MQDFDEVRQVRIQSDRSFRLGGETFVARAFVAPEVIARWQGTNPEGMLAQVKEIDAIIVELLEPGQEDKWKAIRDPELEHPVSLATLGEVVKWLVEQQTETPTVPPSGSSQSAGGTGRSSTAASGSRAARG